MLIKGSFLKVLDNSPATLVKVIHIYNQSKRGITGDLVLVVVKRIVYNRKFLKKSSKGLVRGALFKALIVQTKKKENRFDGSSVQFDNNYCILLSKQSNLIGTRISGPVGLELIFSKLGQRFLSIAPVIL